MRASIAAESAGIPSVSLVCEGFVGQASATGRGLGFDGLPLAVMPGHVDAQPIDVMLANLRSGAVDQVIDGLTRTVAADVTGATDAEPNALDIAVSGSLDEVHRAFAERAWSDGLPIVPPTRERVEAFLEASGHDSWKRLGTATTTGRDVTIWSIAVNGVMAGCRAELLPVLIAIAEILVDPRYGAEHSGNTTGADALIVLDGPCAAELGFRSGQGALRDGDLANTSVGRWLRLYLRNVFGFTPDEHDKATFGNTFRVVLAEDRAALVDVGWPAVSGDFGFGIDDDVVTMVRMNSGAIIGSVFGSSPDEIVPYLADGLARIAGWDLTHVFGLGLGQFRPLLVLSPILARTFSAAGWTRDDVKRAMFEHARIPAWRFEKLIGEWSNLTPGRRTLLELANQGHVPAVFAESDDPDRPVPIVDDPSKIVIAVAGDPDRTNAYVFANDGPHGDWTAKPVDRSRSDDLVCRI